MWRSAALWKLSYLYAIAVSIWHLGMQVFSTPGVVAIFGLALVAVYEPFVQDSLLAAWSLCFACFKPISPLLQWLAPGFFITFWCGCKVDPIIVDKHRVLAQEPPRYIRYSVDCPIEVIFLDLL